MIDIFDGLTGHIVTPFQWEYNKARQGYNRAIQQFPIIIVYCENKTDVANAIIWSRKHCVPIRVRSGGHNYEGYSNGDCTLVIDISRMNHMNLDECSKCLYVESGVTNGQVYDFVSSRGYPFAGGTCPTVGVSGYSLGGGWGLSCRNFGLGCDNLLEIELVNYQGTTIKANRKINCDLFWACQGAGGGNFGVVTAMTFKLPPKVENVTLIEVDYLNISKVQQKEFLSIWQNWLRTADDCMTLIARIYWSEKDGLSMLLRGIFYGEPEEAVSMLDSFLKLENAVYNIEAVSFLEAVTIIGSTYPPFEKFQSASRFVLEDFNEEEIENLVDIIQEPPNGSVFVGISMYALGGKVSEVGTNDTAFYYRNAKYIIWLDTIWEESKYANVNREWIAQNFTYLKQITTGSYVNFPYNKLPDYLEEYYGYHTKKLKKIKEKYDPLVFFSFPQGLSQSELNKENNVSCRVISFTNNEEFTAPKGELNYRGFRYVTREDN
jgi:FAD binding domain/Berberine and berberine like